jgi:hypothetical protein
MVKRGPNLMYRRGARRRAVTPREMAVEEVADDRLVDCFHCATRAAEPAVEVLHSLYVLPNRRRWVAALGEIRDKVVERRAQLTASQSAHDARRAEHKLDHDRFLPGQGAEGSDADYAALLKASTQDSRGLAEKRRITARPA